MTFTDFTNKLFAPFINGRIIKKNEYYSKKYLTPDEIFKAGVSLFPLQNGEYNETVILENLTKRNHWQWFLLLTDKRLILIKENAFGNDIGAKTEDVQELPISNIFDIYYGDEIKNNKFGEVSIHVWKFIIKTNTGMIIMGMNDALKKFGDNLITAFNTKRTVNKIRRLWL